MALSTLTLLAGLVFFIGKDLSGCADLQGLVSEAFVHEVIAPDALHCLSRASGGIHDVLEIPTGQHVGFGQRCYRDVQAIGHTAGAHHFFGDVRAGEFHRCGVTGGSVK